jgi:hypothetical protein
MSPKLTQLDHVHPIFAILPRVCGLYSHKMAITNRPMAKKNIHLTYIELGYVPNIPRMTMIIIANLHHHEHKIVADDKT